MDRRPGRGDEFEDGFYGNLKLGHDVRFVLAAIGGGAVRIGARIARRHLRYLETIAINCDPRVQEAEEFDRQICLGPETGAAGDTGGSPLVGGILARAAEPALARLFEGAPFVTVVASLGGGSGTGALPVVLRAAARSSEVLSAFVIKPFECESDRRALAERAIARLHFIDAFVEKQQRGLATLQILDNEALARKEPRLAFHRLDEHWADVIAAHVERSFLIPAEAALEANRLALVGTSRPINEAAALPPSEPEAVAPPTRPAPNIPNLPPLAAFAPGGDAELTFEVELPARGPGLLG